MPGPRDEERDGFAWREAGAGPLVVLLHGLGGSRVSWEPQLAALAPSRRAVAWDMPGYGAAAPLPDETVTFAALADAAAGLITLLGEERAHIVGISMGGMIAQHLAVRHPHVVRSLTLLSTSPAFGLDGTDPATWRAARLAPLDDGLEPRDFAGRVLGSIAGPGITPEALDGQRTAMARITGSALRRSIDCLVTHDTRAVLDRIAAPTLVLVGALDTETPPAYGEYLAAHIAGAELHVVPGAGHLLNVEAAAAVDDLVIRHLDRVEAT